MFNRILLATDGSSDSLKAAEVAREVSRRHESSITVIYVSPELPTYLKVQLNDSGVDQKKVVKDNAEEVLRKITSHIDDGTTKINALSKIGNPSNIICEIAKDEKYDLIVIGSRGISGVRSYLLGSVSQKVVNHAICPVLVVK